MQHCNDLLLERIALECGKDCFSLFKTNKQLNKLRQRVLEKCTICIEIDQNKFWLVFGLLHRVNGPAVECADGQKEWWINGQIHREDGPAIEYANGRKEWWINGKLCKC